MGLFSNKNSADDAAKAREQESRRLAKESAAGRLAEAKKRAAEDPDCQWKQAAAEQARRNIH